jgi:hypothetical protein
MGQVALILGVVALVLGGSAVGIALTRAGPAGATGQQGTPGPAGTNATDLWAIISATGSIIYDKDANASTTHWLSGYPGSYQVGFNRNVAACSYAATIYAGGYPAAFTLVAPRAGAVDAVFVETFDSGGVATNESFDLQVFC